MIMHKQIIVRAREQHLLKAFRDANPTLSESLKGDIKTAFSAYLSSKLLKVLKETDAPQQGETELATLDKLLKKDQSDAAWSKEMREKEEKFGLILGSLVSQFLFVSGRKQDHGMRLTLTLSP
jgi:cysteinyl-tRNA synthetase